MPAVTLEPKTQIDAETETARHWALRELPPFPSVAVKLLQVLSDEDASIKRLIDLLRSDVALSAEILRRANSAVYGLRTQVASLQHGVALLGFDQVRSLAMSTAMGSYVKPAMRIAALRRCWRHSLATALLAERIAKAAAFEHDRAYTAGLVHDVGLLGLMVNYPKEYAELLCVSREHSLDLRTTERAMFDVDHCEAGSWLARQWSFPNEILEIVVHHHDPGAPASGGLLDIVKSAVVLADSLDFGVQAASQPIRENVYATLRDTLADPVRDCLPLSPSVMHDFLVQRINAFE